MAAKDKSEIHLTRVYNASVKQVWDAWIDPKQVEKWWGPRGFTLTTKQKDVRPGGTWTYTMHGPDGTDYPNKTFFHEVEKYSRLVYDHGANDERPPLFRVTVNFSEKNGKTTMDIKFKLGSPKEAEEMHKFIKAANGYSTWDRLAEFLSDKDNFVINRSFDASIDVMFEMWTNPKHVAQWLPPTGMTMKYIDAHISPGQTSTYSMSGGDLMMYGKIHYIEIKKPHHIVYTQVFCDESGKISRHPLAPTWPETMLTTVTLTEEGPDRTRVTVEWEIQGKATAAERETFLQGRAGMTQGWGGSFDKLDQYLSDRS